MSFKIIRNDITKVKADVIVNTANPKPKYASGTDKAIYQAAGADELLAERKKIGYIECGDVAVTGAYALDAKYIIHTVGPLWVDGNHDEFRTLENCYVRSLEKAVELGCESIAFPLISTGVYGFPKDKALQIAVSVFSKFLMENEIQIILVVFDKKSFKLSSQVIGEIDSYIDAEYVKNQRDSEYFMRSYKGRSIEVESEHDEECNLRNERKIKSVEHGLVYTELSFHDKLFELIDKAEIAKKDVWKRAGLDRKLFSKIWRNENYHPSKKTVMALCLGLRLDLEQSKDLMARADWAFSPSSKFDKIVTNAINNKQYDIMQLNLILFEYTNETL